MQQRPPGIVLSAIALGLVAFFLLLLSFGGLVTMLTGSAHPALGPGAGALSPVALTGFLFGLTLIYLGLAGWSIGTLVGLLRMRLWARVSAIVIAGGIAGLGLLSALSMMAMHSALASGSIPVPPTISPLLLRRVVSLIEGASFLVTGLAIGWLVYLAKRRTRDAFVRARYEAHVQAQVQAQQHATHAPYPTPPAVSPPVPPAWLSSSSKRAPNPMTDFTVARPLDTPTPPVDPVQSAQTPEVPEAAMPSLPYNASGQPWPNPPQHAWAAYPVPPPRAVRTGRPVSITAIAVLALVGAFFSLFQIVSPIPVFLFGMILSGWPVHLYGFVWTVALAIAGLGMLRLQRPAWLLSFVLLGVSALNSLVMLLPAPRAHYVSYMQQLQRVSHIGVGQPSLPPAMLAVTIAAGMLFGLAMIVLVGVLLWRARWAFPVEPAASATPRDTSL